MKRRELLPAVGGVLVAALLQGSPLLAQAAGNAASGSLAVAGDVARVLTLTPADLKMMPRTTVTIPEQGRDVKYTGVLVGEILARAGAPLGRDLSGPAVSTYVLASGKDQLRDRQRDPGV